MSTRKNSSLITHELLLHDAASQGDERKLDDLKVFVKRGKFDINFKDEDWGSRTALHCASEREFKAMSNRFLALSSYRDTFGHTPVKYRVIHDLMLHEAAYAGDAFKLVINLNLLKRGNFDINFKDGDFGNRTALHCAAGEGHLRCCKFLLEGGADPSARMSMGWTPAHCAAEGGHLSVIRLLAESGGTVNAKDDYGDTPKMIAVRYGHKECTEYLQSIEHFPEQRKELLKETFQYAIKKKIKENQMASKTNGE
eukprot:gene7771-13616_t